MKLALSAVFLISQFLAADSLPDVLARMDRSAANFHAVSAHMKRTQYTAVLDDSSELAGEMRLKRTKGSNIVGIIEFGAPMPRTVFVTGHDVQIFYPNANTVELYNLSKYSSNLDQLLVLGFGTSSAELAKAYDIKEGGTQKIGAANTTHIELTPKSAELKKLITKIELWIPDGEGNPVRTKLTEPSKNYSIVDYSGIKLNPPLPDSAYELTLPKGVKKIQNK